MSFRLGPPPKKVGGLGYQGPPQESQGQDLSKTVISNFQGFGQLIFAWCQGLNFTNNNPKEPQMMIADPLNLGQNKNLDNNNTTSTNITHKKKNSAHHHHYLEQHSIQQY